MGKKIAVVFPGIGYHTDKPLLYYGKKTAANRGYEIVEVPYKGFQYGVKGNAEKMHAAFETAMSQTRDILSGTDWSGAEDILFLSKSIGTIVAAAYAQEKGLAVRHVYYTPLKETFVFAAPGNGIAFHGTADPWATDEEIEEGCREKNIPLILVPEGNHSLETGDVGRDLQSLAEVLAETERWLDGTAPAAK